MTTATSKQNINRRILSADGKLLYLVFVAPFPDDRDKPFNTFWATPLSSMSNGHYDSMREVTLNCPYIIETIKTQIEVIK